ncbi:hypothetical protein CPC08DRAFT_763958 [Agrocybe pediades]|nr:hypothetical protein CPC08DRAFT_763958 [Agrocybe pediades]
MSSDEVTDIVFRESSSSATTPLESKDTLGPVPSSNTTHTPLDNTTALPFPPIRSSSPEHRLGANAGRPITGSSFTTNNIKRAWRRSLDAFPSMSMVDSSGFDRALGQNVRDASHHATRIEPNRPSLEGSNGKETPKQRISFDDDRNSPNLRNIGHGLSRLIRSSDALSSLPTSPAMRSSPGPLPDRREKEELNDQHLSSPSLSRSRSRAASPLRLLHQLSSGLHRGHHAEEDPFIPVDPFRFKPRFPFCGFRQHAHGDIEMNASTSSSEAYECDDLIPITSIQSFFKDSRLFLCDILPREVYLNLLLRLPAMYFSRVARIFEDANVSKPDIERMISAQGGTVRHSPTVSPQAEGGFETRTAQGNSTLPPGAVSGIGLSAHIGTSAAAGPMIHVPLPFPDEWTPGVVSPALIRFKHSWEAFIDSLLREWKTLNVVSALLASAILTIFQIPQAEQDPLTRTFALLSLICALLSLSYGCIYIVRFGAMRSMFHASRWAEQAQKTKTSIWWNVWVLLATPAVWMAWSMLLFICSILSFVWRTGSVTDPDDRPPLSAQAALGPRIAITALLTLGMVYLGMIIKSLRKYGAPQNAVRALVQVASEAPRNKAESNPQRTNTNEGKAMQDGPGRGSKKQAQTSGENPERRGRQRERSTSKRTTRRPGEEGTMGRKMKTKLKNFKSGSLRGIISKSQSAVPDYDVDSRGGEEEMEMESDSDVDKKDPDIVHVREIVRMSK